MQYSKRHAGVLSAVGFLVSFLVADSAAAQSCHPPSLREPTETGFHVGFVAVAATFSDVEHGDYQGVIPTVSWHHPWVTADVALPWYRLERDGEEAIGLGDLSADVRVAVFRTESGAFAFGPELGVSFPTGDADKELGMGHVMAMPGAWARLEIEKLSIMAQLGWGRALADADAHAEHAGHEGHEGAAAEAMHATPRVNPMNMNELEHALGLRYAVHPNLAVTGRWLGGVPLDDMGLARQLIGPGVLLTADALDAAIEALVPIAGDPFDVRISISFGAQL
ncbi:MAG TPA: hypothetical protein VFG30_19195 [Polyangiales bacterium]|nr:hypothetical protein [Polyangiales bacterium]